MVGLGFLCIELCFLSIPEMLLGHQRNQFIINSTFRTVLLFGTFFNAVALAKRFGTRDDGCMCELRDSFGAPTNPSQDKFFLTNPWRYSTPTGP